MFALRSDLGPRRLCEEKCVTVMSTVPGCDVTTVQRHYKGSTSTPPRVARLCQIREASLVALRKISHKSTLAYMCRSFESSTSPHVLLATRLVTRFRRASCQENSSRSAVPQTKHRSQSVESITSQRFRSDVTRIHISLD